MDENRKYFATSILHHPTNEKIKKKDQHEKIEIDYAMRYGVQQ